MTAEHPPTKDLVSPEALRQQITYWRERKDDLGIQLAALLNELEWRRARLAKAKRLNGWLRLKGGVEVVGNWIEERDL